jgi:hypothetical protein
MRARISASPARRPARKRRAKLVEQPAQLVDLHGTELNQQRPHPMQRQHGLLILRLRRYRAHSCLLHRRPNRPRIRGIGLVGLHKRANELRMQQ